MRRRSATAGFLATLVLTVVSGLDAHADTPPEAPSPAAPDDSAVEQARALVKDGHYAEAEAARAFLDGRKSAGDSDSSAVARMTRVLVESLLPGTRVRDVETRELARHS